MPEASAPRARIAVLFLTSACDMDCPYCGAAAHFPHLPVAQAELLLLELARSGFESVVFGGGEPMLWPGDLRRLCAQAKALGLSTQIGTNLNLLPPGASAWPEVDRWVVPLESADAPAHDHLRPTAGSHHAVVLAALAAFQAAGATVTISSVARKLAETDLYSVGEFLRIRRAQGLKLHAWHVYRFQAMGRGGSHHEKLFSQSDSAWDLNAAELKARFADLPLLLRPNMLHSREVAFFWNSSRGLWRQGPLSWSGPALPA